MQYGHFDDEQREYVIHRPDTPLPWINYLGCKSYFALISNTAGGYSFYKDARLRRITRYRYNNVPPDVGGRYIYLRDEADGEYWSPTWQPVQSELDEYSCRHGLGYTTISSTMRGIESQIRYFVPNDAHLEIWDLSLKNTRDREASLAVFSTIEFAFWNAQDDATNFQRNLNLGEVEVEDQVIYHKTEYRERRNHFAFFACSEQLSGFDTHRAAFLGPYRGWEAPVVVEQGESKRSLATGWSPIGSHHLRLQLAPGQSKRMIFLLGYHENPEDQKFDPPDSQVLNKRMVEPIIRQYLDPAAADDAFDEMREHWQQLLSALQIETPDVHVNRIVNAWNPYQCMATFNLGRSASYYESGISRGIGFRDANQDLLGCVNLTPERARQRILDLSATQHTDGSVFHQYQPLTKRGNHDLGSGFNDDPLWLILSTAAYLRETGDLGILQQPVVYDHLAGSERPLYDHLQASLRYTLERLGPHGLPLIGRADWNDCLNLNTHSDTPDESFQTAPSNEAEIAESVFIAGLFVLAARELADIASKLGKGDDAETHKQAAMRMKSAVLQHGWDGSWFLRAYDAHGRKVGSQGCAEGKIYIEPQGICPMAGIGLDDGLAERALDSVRQQLATPHGLTLLQPAYSRYDIDLGEISSYPPGYKENAAVFCHTNPWIIIAEAMLDRGDQALDYYLRINPSAREPISDIHRCEPYVYAQMIAGPDAAAHGEAKNSWLTATAAWCYVAITQWILGLRPTYQGLRLAPVIPREWPGFKATRAFRGVTYQISVERAGEGNDVSLEVDGKAQPGNTIPLPPDDVHVVEVKATLT